MPSARRVSTSRAAPALRWSPDPLKPVTQGVITARAQISGQSGRTLQGQATVCDQDGNPVLDFTCTFKVAEDRVIRGIGWRSL